jgi:hypothetical protein
VHLNPTQTLAGDRRILAKSYALRSEPVLELGAPVCVLPQEPPHDARRARAYLPLIDLLEDL